MYDSKQPPARQHGNLFETKSLTRLDLQLIYLASVTQDLNMAIRSLQDKRRFAKMTAFRRLAQKAYGYEYGRQGSMIV